jgi:DNA primase
MEPGTRPTVAERAALLLAIKEPGVTVPMAHLVDKVARDARSSGQGPVNRAHLEVALGQLVRDGFATSRQEGFVATTAIDRFVEHLVAAKPQDLNRSYTLVWLAKHYYRKAARLLLPFLKGRPISTVKLFSGKRDPLRETQPIFVRYARYKPRPVPLTVDSAEHLMRLVFDHCIDFIPYIQRLGAHEPDTFVIDLDAGTALLEHTRAFEYLKFVTAQLRTLLLERDVSPMVKFSGSRGFQVWAHLDNERLRGEGDLFRAYRNLAVGLQRALEARLQRERTDIRATFGDAIAPSDHPLTTSQVAHKAARSEQVLVDWSVLKPMGDVRAPFSMHYKTGLVSLPLSAEQLAEFDPTAADPLQLLSTLDQYAAPSEIPVSSPRGLLALR